MGSANESVRAKDRGVMSSQEAVHVSLIKVTPRSGKETLGTWWFHCQRGGWTQSRPKPTHEMELSCEQTIRGRGVCVPALEPRGEREGSRTKQPRLQTGPGKFGRPAVCPGKAGVSSGGQTHRGKSQEPRSSDSGEEENRISETYRQSHLQDGEQAIGP